MDHNNLPLGWPIRHITSENVDCIPKRLNKLWDRQSSWEIKRTVGAHVFNGSARKRRLE